MPRNVQLSSLIAQARQRSNREKDDAVNGFVTDSELTGYINNSIAWLWDELITADACTARTRYPLAITQGQDTYALPADFYKELAVEYQINANGNQWIDVRRCPFAERNKYSLLPVTVMPGAVPFRYYLEGSAAAGMSIIFTPQPASPASVRVIYVATAPVLANPGDTLDGINGFEEFVILDAAIKCLVKEESDASTLMAERAAQLDRIRSMAKDRDASEPERMSDVGQLYGWDGGIGDGGGIYLMASVTLNIHQPSGDEVTPRDLRVAQENVRTALNGMPKGLQLAKSAPSSSSAVGNFGDCYADANFFYICIGVNAWRRVALSSF